MQGPALKCRLAVTFVLLSLTMGTLALTSAEVRAQAEFAPRGSYISNTPAYGLPPPAGLYESRLIWIIAALRDNVGSRSPFGGRWINQATLPPVARQALDREMAAVPALPEDQRMAYQRALIRDLSTLEIADLDNQAFPRVSAAVISDFTANFIVTVALGRAVDEIFDKARAVIIAEKNASKEALRARLRASIDSVTVRTRAFDSYRARYGGAFNERQLLSEFGKSVTGDPHAPPISNAMAVLLMEQAPNPSKASELVLKQKMMNILLDAEANILADAAVARLGRGNLSILRMRHQALLEYLSIRCGCSHPLGADLASPTAWEAILPPVSQSYQTRLGRLLAASSKGGFHVVFGGVQFRQEIDRIKGLGRGDPARLAAFLAHFVQDIDALQAELMEDASSSVGFVEDLAASVVATIFLPAGTAASTIGSILISAGYAGLAAYTNLSAERKVMVQMEVLRSQTLDLLDRLPPPCGCNAKLAVVSLGTRQGN